MKRQEMVQFIRLKMPISNEELQNMELDSVRALYVLNGGSGSGNFGHSGRPGEVGGSGEGGGGAGGAGASAHAEEYELTDADIISSAPTPKAVELSPKEAVAFYRLTKQQAAARAAKVPPAELARKDKGAIRAYTGQNNYEALNKNLREGKQLSRKLQKISDNMDSALQKLPKMEGTVSRGVWLKPDAIKKFLSDHAPGKIVTYKSFTSAEAGGGAAYAKGGKNTSATGVRLNIISKSARSVAKYSAYPRENEVIFPRNTSFVVGGVSRDKESGLVIINMQEV